MSFQTVVQEGKLASLYIENTGSFLPRSFENKENLVGFIPYSNIFKGMLVIEAQDMKQRQHSYM